MIHQDQINQEKFDSLIKGLSFIKLKDYPPSPYLPKAEFLGRYALSLNHHDYFNLLKDPLTEELILEEVSCRRILKLYWLKNN